MDTLQIILLAIIQGFTEFLPISSSAHLILPAQILGWQDQGLSFDVAVHIGSLLAVIIYFRLEIKNMLFAWTRSLITREQTTDSQLAWWIILATIPAVVIGFTAKDLVETYLRSPMVIAITTIVFGLLLLVADRLAKNELSEYQAGWKKALLIGFAQALALIPGTSRSGITMTAGLLLGLTKEAAARFSFLMSIPVILGAALLMGKDLLDEGQVIDWSALGLGVALSFAAAYLCIHFFLKVISKMGMMPFVIYRLLLGALLFTFLYLN